MTTLVGHEFAGIHVGLGLDAKLGSLLDGRAKQVAVERCVKPNSSTRRADWVPFPGAGGAQEYDVHRILLSLFEEAVVIVHLQLALQLGHRVERDADHDEDGGSAKQLDQGVARERVQDGRMIAMAARNIAPGSVMRLITFLMYCTVAPPGRTPGMKPPLFFRLSAVSCGW